MSDSHNIGDALATREGHLSLGENFEDVTDPMPKMFSDMLAVFADFDADLLKMRMCEGMAFAHSRGELKDRRPNLFPRVRAAGGTSASVRMDGASDYITPMAPSPTAP